MPRSSKAQAEINHRRIVQAAGRLFRSRGYAAVGISDVMKAAGMTQGGFYKQFSSKTALAREAWTAGFDAAMAHWRDGEGAPGVAGLVASYLAPRPTEQCCPMLAHGEEAARADDASGLRQAYSAGAERLHDTFVELAGGEVGKDRADLLFAAMVGVGLLSRATDGAEWVGVLERAVRTAAAPHGEPGTQG